MSDYPEGVHSWSDLIDWPRQLRDRPRSEATMPEPQGVPDVRSVTVCVTVSRVLRDVLADMADAIERSCEPFPFANPIREIVRLYDSALCPTCGAPNGGGYITLGCPDCREARRA